MNNKIFLDRCGGTEYLNKYTNKREKIEILPTQNLTSNSDWKKFRSQERGLGPLRLLGRRFPRT
jgi:hypothetical protein